MRDKYTVMDFYPVMDSEGKVSYTTSDKYYFKFWVTAKLFYFGCKFLNYVFCPDHLYRYLSVWMHYIPRYGFSVEDLGVQTDDCSTYTLETSGDSRQELLNNASISRVGRDGADLATFGIDEGNEAAEYAWCKIDSYCEDRGLL